MTGIGRNACRTSPGTSCAPQALLSAGSVDQPVLMPGRCGRRRAHLPRWFTRLTRLGLPRRFPIVQFPNLPLLAAIVAGRATDIAHGPAGSYLRSVSYLAMTVWAYEELVHGVNWFRRLLGLVFAILLIMRVAHAVNT
jgi:hypothetical protein